MSVTLEWLTESWGEPLLYFRHKWARLWFINGRTLVFNVDTGECYIEHQGPVLTTRDAVLSAIGVG